MFDGDEMDECNAALVLMSLSCSPNSPRQGESSSLPLACVILQTSGREWHLNASFVMMMEEFATTVLIFFFFRKQCSRFSLE